MDAGAHRDQWMGRGGSWAGVGGSIPSQSACRDQMAAGRVGNGPQDSVRSWAAPSPWFPGGKCAPGTRQLPNKVVRAQERSCHTRWPWGAPCKSLVPARLRVWHKPCQNPTEPQNNPPGPQNNPPVLTQLSQWAKRTQQTAVTPSHRCHLSNSLACSSQQSPGLQREAAVVRQFHD